LLPMLNHQLAARTCDNNQRKNEQHSATVAVFSNKFHKLAQVRTLL
jgi:hypothetical protein